MIEQKSRSETARLITKTEVAWARSFLSLTKLTTVTRLPKMPRAERMQASTPPAMVADTLNGGPLLSSKGGTVETFSIGHCVLFSSSKCEVLSVIAK